MRVVEMDPNKKRGLAILFHPLNCVTDHIAGAALDAFVAAFIAPAFGMKTSVEKIEATIKSGRHICLWIQDQRTDESRCVVTALLQNFRNVWQQGWQRMTEISDGVELRIGTRKDGGVGNRRQRRLGISLFEYDPLAGDLIQIRRKAFLGTEEPHAIGAGGVDCNEDDVGCFGAGKGGNAGNEGQEKQRQTEHGNRAVTSRKGRSI